MFMGGLDRRGWSYSRVVVYNPNWRYTFMGGLGAFFYMSYFNSAAILILIVVFLLKIFYDSSANNVLGPSVAPTAHLLLSAFWRV